MLLSWPFAYVRVSVYVHVGAGVLRSWVGVQLPDMLVAFRVRQHEQPHARTL